MENLDDTVIFELYLGKNDQIVFEHTGPETMWIHTIYDPNNPEIPFSVVNTATDEFTAALNCYAAINAKGHKDCKIVVSLCFDDVMRLAEESLRKPDDIDEA